MTPQPFLCAFILYEEIQFLKGLFFAHLLAPSPCRLWICLSDYSTTLCSIFENVAQFYGKCVTFWRIHWTYALEELLRHYALVAIKIKLRKGGSVAVHHLSVTVFERAVIEFGELTASLVDNNVLGHFLGNWIPMLIPPRY